ncbi:MAG TPA: UDP-N-acetylglucosamine 2-epimerase (non-hydrolyzing) [Candidatus Polarisedimenticolia bacterium]|nr:UDP-N-acetylglucosamine 2-epimerase (non-hydrolyzing) [Candidatus Polarisedimenticolia bacterium]
MKIHCVVGARPNFMKIAPLMREMLRHPEMRPVLVHTGQHYDPEMSEVFFNDLEIPSPDLHLGVGSGSQASQTGKVMVAFEAVLEQDPADLVLLVGDVNSTLACSVVAAKAGVPVAHVEAGLRSWDRSMPEEINRIVTDALSTYHFTTSRDADENLLREGAEPSRIFFVGNVMIDTLLRFQGKVDRSPIRAQLRLPRDYALLTLHRPSNVDDVAPLKRIFAALEILSRRLPIVFPIHPRTRKMLEEFGVSTQAAGIRTLDPIGYIDFIHLEKNARLVLTDSGGIQEETSVLGVPCLTLRDNTERPVTLREGTNVLVGNDTERILAAAERALDGERRATAVPELWDGRASERIVAHLRRIGLPD